jgi:transposase InsO family protein
VSERGACELLDLDRRTIQNWRRYGPSDRRKGSVRFVPHRLTDEERRQFLKEANSPRFADKTPDHLVAILAQEEKYIASPSTLYRILREEKALAHRRESKKPRAAEKPNYLTVTGPNQVWSWDITWLRTDVAGIFLYGYTVIDLFDRSIVGWTIEASESEEHATRLFRRIMRDLGVVPGIVHADNGNPMRGVTLAVFLDSLLVKRSYSRPRCSNDNAFIESWHKTLKYSVGYPSRFDSLDQARRWYADFVHWYNTEHLHSGIGYVTPAQMRSGEAEVIFETRNRTIAKARLRNPLRWRMSKIYSYGPNTVQSLYRPLNPAA